MSVLKLNQIQTASGVIMANLNSSGANAGIQLASNLAPAFSASGNTSYSITTNVDTKVRFQNKRFDTANCFDNVTNFRFTPNVAGYYQVNYIVRFQTAASPAMTIAYSMLFKNGRIYITGNQFMGVSTGTNWDIPSSELVYMNGTTDYLEVYLNVGGTSILINDNTTTAFVSSFSGFLARSA